MTTVEELLLLINEDEHTHLEFKDSRILSNNFKLAKSITSIANAGGGKLLIGVRRDKSIEGITYKQGHEEHLQEITYNHCEPIVKINFEKVKVHEKGFVYIIDIPSKSSTYHAVRGKKGYSFFIRHGSTTHELGFSDVTNPNDLVEEPIDSSSFCKIIGRLFVKNIYGELNVDISNFIKYSTILGLCLIFVPFLLIFGYDGKITLNLVDYSLHLQSLLVFSIIFGSFIIGCIQKIPNTKCPKCESYFSFYPKKKIIHEKEVISENLEHEKSRIIKKCEVCGYEKVGKMRYRKIDTSRNT